MTRIAPEDVLEPDPARAVQMMLAVCHGPWPATDAAVRDLFSGLGLRAISADVTAAAVIDDPASAEIWPSPIDIHHLETQLGGQVYASWAAYAGDFLGLDLQLYNTPHPNDPHARVGYDRILGLLIHALGAPTDAWDDEATPPREWAVGRWRIVLHLFALRDSGVMLSVHDTATSDRAEREASDRQAAWDARGHA